MSGGAGRAAAGSPLCSAGQLSLVFVDSTGAAGSTDVEYGFRNRAAHACVLEGYPVVRMLKASGASLSTTEVHTPGAWGITPKPVDLAHGKIAYFGIHFADATGYGRLQCPVSGALELTAPGTSTGHVLHGRGGRIRPFGGTTVHLRCGVVRVSAVTAKRFQ